MTNNYIQFMLLVLTCILLVETWYRFHIIKSKNKNLTDDDIANLLMEVRTDAMVIISEVIKLDKASEKGKEEVKNIIKEKFIDMIKNNKVLLPQEKEIILSANLDKLIENMVKEYEILKYTFKKEDKKEEPKKLEEDKKEEPKKLEEDKKNK